MGPVWEANHVWLIFVFVVCWTAYPTVFALISPRRSAVPLLIAAIGIILRGTAYALRAQSDDGEIATGVERVFGASSVLTPFALGAVVGAIASGRVPVGNARGDLLTSWLSPTGIVIGALSVATSSYLASVFLVADAQRVKSVARERVPRACAHCRRGRGRSRARRARCRSLRRLSHLGRINGGWGLGALVASAAAGLIHTAPRSRSALRASTGCGRPRRLIHHCGLGGGAKPRATAWAHDR